MIQVDNHNITISGNRIDLSVGLIILFSALMREKVLSYEVIKSILDYAESPENNPIPIIESLIKMRDDAMKEDARESFVNLMDGVFRRGTNND
jgi:transcription termination factor NusB